MGEIQWKNKEKDKIVKLLNIYEIQSDKLGEMTENNSRITQLFKERKGAQPSRNQRIGIEINEQGNASKLLFDILWHLKSTICLVTYREVICDAKFIYVIHYFIYIPCSHTKRMNSLSFCFDEGETRKRKHSTKC